MKAKNLTRSLDNWLWFLIRILPFFCFFVSFFSVGTDVSFVTFISAWSFNPISNLINTIFADYLNSSCVLSGYISYLILVDLIRIIYYVVSFMLVFASSFVEKMSRLGGE